MKEELTAEQISKLPKRVQEHIARLTREKENAERVAEKCLQDQIPSPIWCDNWDQGLKKLNTKYYIPHNRLTIQWCGVMLNLILRGGGNNVVGRNNCIDLQWEAIDRRLIGLVAFVPTSFQHASLIAIENCK